MIGTGSVRESGNSVQSQQLKSDDVYIYTYGEGDREREGERERELLREYVCEKESVSERDWGREMYVYLYMHVYCYLSDRGASICIQLRNSNYIRFAFIADWCAVFTGIHHYKCRRRQPDKCHSNPRWSFTFIQKPPAKLHYLFGWCFYRKHRIRCRFTWVISHWVIFTKA